MTFSWTNVKEAFWSETFWFPTNISWKDFDNENSAVYHPHLSDLKYSCLVGMLLLIVRFMFFRFVGKPLGLWLGIPDKKKKMARRHSVLNRAFANNRNPTNKIIQGLVKQTDLSEREILRWFRLRRNQDKSTVIDKFTEGSWRFTVYTIAFIYGLYVLWDKPWFTSSEHFWVGYPHHHVSSDMYWYYMGELGLYYSLLLSHFMDIKRKDFWELLVHHIVTILLMLFTWVDNWVRFGTFILLLHDASDPFLEDFWELLVHHIVTILLMLFTWVDNWVRFGTFILLLHDASDPFLEFAKVAIYAKYKKLSDPSLAIFVILWVITRLILYPYRCVWGVIQLEYESSAGCYNVYITLLVSLLILHIIWSYFIFRSIFNILTHPEKVRKDYRSSEEESISENDDHNDDVMNEEVKKLSS